jgi:hypothetical protein
VLSERELQNSLSGRRSFLKLLAAAPLFATIGKRSLAATMRSAGKSRPRRERPNHLQIISMTMQPGEDLLVGNRFRQILDKARKQAV